MLDQFGFAPSRAFLTREAAGVETITEGFGSWRRIEARSGSTALVVEFRMGNDPIVRIHAAPERAGLWRVRKIRANLPSLLHGHNGRSIASQQDYFLALTRLEALVARVIEPQSGAYILPGQRTDPAGHLLGVEAMIQVVDEGQRLLLASHSSRRKGQRGPNRVYPGQSTKTAGRISVAVYDKVMEMAKKKAAFYYPGPPVTRIEVIAKKGSDLAMELARMKDLSPADYQVISTLAYEDAFSLVIRNLKFMIGFNWGSSMLDVAKFNRTSRHLISGLGSDVKNPIRVEQALENYLKNEKPCARTANRIEKEIRSWAVACHMPSVADIVPEKLEDLRSVCIPWPQREQEFSDIATKYGLPLISDANIVSAWSQSRLLVKGEVTTEDGFQTKFFRKS